MSGRLKLRRGVVVSAEPLVVEVDGERRPTWADAALLGEMHEGDEVVVNVEALDLGLGSGGFDVVHVNLTRGLDASGSAGEHVMKLNYSSLQHPVEPIELPVRPLDAGGAKGAPERADEAIPVLVLPLHGHLAPAAWAAAQASPRTRGRLRADRGRRPARIAQPRRSRAARAQPALRPHHCGAGLWRRARVDLGGRRFRRSRPQARVGRDHRRPRPSIIGSDSRLGHGGMAALDTAHASLALGLPTLLSPRLSSADPRERHRPVSHHTLTVMQLLLGGVEVPVPTSEPVPIAVLATAAGWRHRLHEAPVDLDGYEASKLPARTMGRTLAEDPLFFAAALASGRALADSTAGGVGGGGSRT